MLPAREVVSGSCHSPHFAGTARAKAPLLSYLIPFPGFKTGVISAEQIVRLRVIFAGQLPQIPDPKFLSTDQPVN